MEDLLYRYKDLVLCNQEVRQREGRGRFAFPMVGFAPACEGGGHPARSMCPIDLVLNLKQILFRLLPVHFLAVSNFDDVDGPLVIVDLIDDTVISPSDAILFSVR